jgi:uncharacterized membrane protein YtjA (UPF0391 family)
LKINLQTVERIACLGWPLFSPSLPLAADALGFLSVAAIAAAFAKVLFVAIMVLFLLWKVSCNFDCKKRALLNSSLSTNRQSTHNPHTYENYTLSGPIRLCRQRIRWH